MNEIKQFAYYAHTVLNEWNEQGKRKQIVLCLIGMLALVTFTLLLLALFIKVIFINLDKIMGVAIIGIFVYWSYQDYQSKSKVDIKDKIEFEEVDKKESIYQAILLVLLDTINDFKGYYGLLAINDPSSLIANVKYNTIEEQDIYCYNCYANTPIDNVDRLKRILNKRIAQRLRMGYHAEFPTGEMIYNGMTYPVIEIMQIRNCNGYINLYVVLNSVVSINARNSRKNKRLIDRAKRDNIYDERY